MSVLKRYGPSRHRAIPEFQPASEAQKAIFLRRFEETRNVSIACKAAGIRRNLYNHALATDPEFRERHAEIDDFYIDKLEVIGWELAAKGSEAMLKFMLQSLRPEKFGGKTKVEVSHRFQSVEDIRKMSDEDLEVAFEELGLKDES